MTTSDTPTRPSRAWRKGLAALSLPELKLEYKRSQIRAGRGQVVIALMSFFAVLVAIWVAMQGQDTVNHNSQTALQQSEDSQLSTAITALGSSDEAERIAGVLLLTQNVSSRLKLSTETGEPPANIYSDYVAVLQIFSGYIRSHGEDFLSSAGTGAMEQQFGLGYGTPLVTAAAGDIPIDLNYAADQLPILLGLEGEVTSLKSGLPAIDLSNDELYRQDWKSVNFSWITAYMPGIDLRGADLTSSRWSGNSTLSGAYLQCADLEGADFQGANLSGADLRGANVDGADFRGATLTGAKITQLYGSAKWPRGWRHEITTLPVKEWNQETQETCLHNSQFSDNPPTVAPVSLPSPRPSSPAATPEPSASKGRRP